MVGDGEVEALIFNYLKSYSVCKKEGMKWGAFQRTPHLKGSEKVYRKAELIKIALGEGDFVIWPNTCSHFMDLILLIALTLERVQKDRYDVDIDRKKSLRIFCQELVLGQPSSAG